MMELKDLDKRARYVLENCSAPIIGFDGKPMKLEELIIDFKMKAVTKIDAFLEELAKVKKVRENWKGNISLDSFDGSLRIERKIDDCEKND